MGSALFVSAQATFADATQHPMPMARSLSAARGAKIDLLGLGRLGLTLLGSDINPSALGL
jgi:hypothetical protein